MSADYHWSDCLTFRNQSTSLAIHYAQLGHRCLREDSATERAPRTIGREAIEGGEAGLLSLDLGTLNTPQIKKPTGFGALGQHRVSIAGAFCVSRCVRAVPLETTRQSGCRRHGSTKCGNPTPELRVSRCENLLELPPVTNFPISRHALDCALPDSTPGARLTTLTFKESSWLHR